MDLTARQVFEYPMFYDFYGTPHVRPVSLRDCAQEIRENSRKIHVLEAKIDYIANALTRIEAKLDAANPAQQPPNSTLPGTTDSSGPGSS